MTNEGIGSAWSGHGLLSWRLGAGDDLLVLAQVAVEQLGVAVVDQADGDRHGPQQFAVVHPDDAAAPAARLLGLLARGPLRLGVGAAGAGVLDVVTVLRTNADRLRHEAQGRRRYAQH